MVKVPVDLRLMDSTPLTASTLRVLSTMHHARSEGLIWDRNMPRFMWTDGRKALTILLQRLKLETIHTLNCLNQAHNKRRKAMSFTEMRQTPRERAMEPHRCAWHYADHPRVKGAPAELINYKRPHRNMISPLRI